MRPCSSRIPSNGKYSGLTKFKRASGFSAAVLPKISIRVSLPLDGGVAFVEIPASIACGISAIQVLLPTIGRRIEEAVSVRQRFTAPREDRVSMEYVVLQAEQDA